MMICYTVRRRFGCRGTRHCVSLCGIVLLPTTAGQVWWMWGRQWADCCVSSSPGKNAVWGLISLITRWHVGMDSWDFLMRGAKRSWCVASQACPQMYRYIRKLEKRWKVPLNPKTHFVFQQSSLKNNACLCSWHTPCKLYACVWVFVTWNFTNYSRQLLLGGIISIPAQQDRPQSNREGFRGFKPCEGDTLKHTFSNICSSERPRRKKRKMARQLRWRKRILLPFKVLYLNKPHLFY